MLAEIAQFQKWLRRRSPNTSTPRHYTSDVQLFFLWSNKPPGAISVHDIDLFIEHCQQLGHAVTTVNRRLASLRAFYEFLAVESDDAPANPVLPKRHCIRIGRHLPRDVEDEVVQKLFAVIARPRDRAMFLLMLRCGLRVSEVHNLSLGDVYLQPAPDKLPRLWLRGKGGGKERVVYLSPQPLAALKAWLAVRPPVVDQAVFLNRFGRRLSVTGIELCLGAYCRAIDVWLTCHQLRHTLGRHLTEARLPITSIQRLLGHSRLRTTEIYLHISDGQVQADFEAAMIEITTRLPLGLDGGAA